MFVNLLIANIRKNSQFAINRYSQLKSVLRYTIIMLNCYDYLYNLCSWSSYCVFDQKCISWLHIHHNHLGKRFIQHSSLISYELQYNNFTIKIYTALFFHTNCSTISLSEDVKLTVGWHIPQTALSLPWDLYLVPLYVWSTNYQQLWNCMGHQLVLPYRYNWFFKVLSTFF